MLPTKPIQPSCTSEHGELEAVLLCSPSVLDVPDLQTAEDVQWNAPVDQAKAHESFASVRDTLRAEGVHIIDYSTELTEEESQLSRQLINRFFVRDLACVFGEIILPGEPGISMRRPEYIHAHRLLETWFPKQFHITANNNMPALEFGDCLVLNQDAVWINVGLRSNVTSVDVIKDTLFQAGFSEIGIIDLPRRPDTLHLDMNCNVAHEDLILSKSYVRYFPLHVLTRSGARYEMPEQFLKRHGFEVYWIKDCKTVPDINFLNVNPETLLISKDAHKQMLTRHDKLHKKNIIEVDVTELEKGGGGIRCMTLPLVRKAT
ncbi:hypothetical protein E6C60_4106 [Paenibacillus algicola]|uniref:Arginine deiminase n=1 Tax=Paenibacillus algicola TaxID=2565926 RepID=A0A4P8XSD0_9BACL|nr:arginine deiminase family protein [Paenibacillus algicola]QCT04811.1 hypothetical protein E6C60_4106 [Paenibacillus algicola]